MNDQPEPLSRCSICGDEIEPRTLIRPFRPALTYWPCACGVTRVWHGDPSDVNEDFDF